MKFFSTILILTFLVTSLFANKNEGQNPMKNPPEWSKNLTIYEVNLRQFSEKGDFKSFEKSLPKLKELGVGIIWFMPIHPIGEKNRKGSLGSYYSVKDYFGVNPEFGTMEEFKALVKKIHEMGMFVLIDWVANHCAWDNPILEKNPDWFTKDENGNFKPPVDDWTDVVDFDYENKELRKYMTEALKFWVKEANIDGYRCDVAGMVPYDFWEEAVPELHKIKPVFMLAEWETPEIHNSFHMSYAWNIHKAFNAIAKGKKNAKSIDELVKKELKEFPKGAYRMHFTTNHDENSWNGTVQERLGESANAFSILTFTLPGMPLIYNGQEAGMNKRLAFFEKDFIEWKKHPNFDLFKDLVKLKKSNKALWSGDFGGNYKKVETSNESSILAFLRKLENNEIFVIVNLSEKPQETILGGKDLKGSFTEYFTNEKNSFNNENRLKLKPWGYKVFVKK